MTMTLERESAERGLEFNQALSEVRRKEVSKELQGNRVALGLLTILQSEQLPETAATDLSAFSILTRLVDRHEGPLPQRLLDVKLDMLDSASRMRGDRETYTHAVGRLFDSIGYVTDEEELGLITERLENAEEGQYSPERVILMESRKEELEHTSK